MGVTFHASPISGPFGDPVLYVRIFREKRALLLDLGDIGSLGPGSLLKVSDVFVTHTHIDHFIGFDVLLRTCLRSMTPLRVFGPRGITGCVEGKLRGYSWNLIRDYPLKIEVYEVEGAALRHHSFHAEKAFHLSGGEERPFEGTLLRDQSFTVRGVTLSHDIPVMAYSIEEEYHINIDKQRLKELDLSVGPWLSDLKKAIRAGLPDTTAFEVDGRIVTLPEARAVATITKGQKISYVTDASPIAENLKKIVAFVKGSDQLFCEAYFLDQDRTRARERNHLTAALAGRIAREAAVGSLVLLHFSPKYRTRPEALYQEAQLESGGDVR
jgi:ribonuclease Z